MKHGKPKRLASTLGTDVVISRAYFRNCLLHPRRKGARTKTQSAKKFYEKIAESASRELERRRVEVVPFSLGWHWPYLRESDGPEYSCPHSIGHSEGVHGCDGCCADKNFPRKDQGY